MSWSRRLLKAPGAVPAGLTALCFAVAFAQRPGKAFTDARIELTVDPGGFLGDVADVWSSTGDLGHVSGGLFAGYLFPAGPWYALMDGLGVPDWIGQRLLLGLILALSAWGAVRLIHHRVFATMRSFDATLVSLNLLYLSLVVLIPFTTEVLGEYGDTSVGVMVYAAVMGLVALVNWLMIRHVVNSGHVRAEAREQTARFGGRRALEIPAVFLLSIPVALVHPYAAEALWILLLVVVRRRMR